MHPIVRNATAAVVAASGVVALAWLAQRRLLYFPVRGDREATTRLAGERGLEPWTGPDGSFLGWRSAHPTEAPVARALVLHGNAASALERTYLRDVLQGPGLPPVEVFLLEYPGYGAREGAPSEEAIVSAVTEAIDRLGGDLPVLLVGESLGSAAAALAAERRSGVKGLLLVTPVASIAGLARRHYPFVPGWFVRDPFRADRALPRYPGRAAFLVAGRDEVAPPDQALALHAAFPGEKWLRVDPVAGHNTLPYRPGDPLWGEILEFLLD